MILPVLEILDDSFLNGSSFRVESKFQLLILQHDFALRTIHGRME